MKKIWAGLILGLLAAGPLWAGSETYDFEVLNASATTAVSLATSKTAIVTGGAPACGVLVSVETAAVRFRTDGTAPTAAVGHLVAVNDSFVVDSLADLRRLQVVPSVATSTATLQVSYWRGCE